MYLIQKRHSKNKKSLDIETVPTISFYFSINIPFAMPVKDISHTRDSQAGHVNKYFC